MNRIFLCCVALCFLIANATCYAQGTSDRAPRPKSAPCRNIHTITDCPDEGCGGRYDPDLNKEKNVRPAEQEPILRSIAWMKALRNPRHFTAKNRSREELKQLGEGQTIRVTAWALAARKGGQETCNCKLKTKADTDNHIVLVDAALKNPTLTKSEKRDSETAEFTPRVRLDHPNFTQDNLEPLIDSDWQSGERPAKGKLLVRVTGVLMFDSEHFLQHPLKRHNNWEIHPVLKMEYCPGGETCDPETDDNWVDLESE
jgi:hypothetical protein